MEVRHGQAAGAGESRWQPGTGVRVRHAPLELETATPISVFLTSQLYGSNILA